MPVRQVRQRAWIVFPRARSGWAPSLAVLHAIARQGEQATVRQIQAASGLANNVLQPTLASLVHKGLVYRPTRGLVAFSAPLFGAYLRRRGDDAA